MTTTNQRNTAGSDNRRAKPGTKGTGKFYRIVVHPKDLFVKFRNQDVGKPGGLERVAGQRQDGRWDTQAWLISKDDAHVKNDTLEPDSDEAKELLEKLDGELENEKADIFRLQNHGNMRHSM